MANTAATTTPQWNMADMFDAVARTVPADRPAIVQGARTVTWGQLDARSNRLARALIAAGHLPGERVGFLSRNHPGYIEGFIACLKARLIHVNLNYRYTLDEIAGVMEDAGATPWPVGLSATRCRAVSGASTAFPVPTVARVIAVRRASLPPHGCRSPRPSARTRFSNQRKLHDR